MGQLRAFRPQEDDVIVPQQESIRGLLLRYGFSTAVWQRPLGHLWCLVGEVDGIEVIVTCMPFAEDGFFLQVQSPKAREWLLDLLAEHDFWDVEVRCEPLVDENEPAPWLALTVVIGAVALFGWVVTSIGLHGG